MSAESINLRESCLIARARACAAGYRRIGLQFSADLTDGLADGIEAGLCGALFEHWIGEQEQRLAGKMAAV